MSLILNARHLGTPPWPTLDPFLFCVHHKDDYPKGNEAMGPDAPLSGRQIGSDFAGKDGWSMYHGHTVPGFPRHPHRGFETITLMRSGYIDHSDSLGATARFGEGDVQWMTAGKGIQHAEMFPLTRRDADNPAELFQLWINLPKRDKMVEPHFTMLWAHTMPRVTHVDSDGKKTEVVVLAGALGDRQAPPPPPSSWAADPANHVAIYTLQLEPGARYTLPATEPGVNRTLYTFEGPTAQIDGLKTEGQMIVHVKPDADLPVQAGPEGAQILVLQGKPIGEPVAQHGPFVMNTRDELIQAYADYRTTQFGGWPWTADDPTHAREQGRFAVHADGRREEPGV